MHIIFFAIILFFNFSVKLLANQFEEINIDQKQKNVFINSIKSAIVPGWGELCLDNKLGYSFIASEVVFFTTMFYFKEEAKLRMKQSQQFAFNNANLVSPYFDKKIWYHLSRYDRSGFEIGGYNESVLKEAFLKYPYEHQIHERTNYILNNILDENISWEWGKRDNRSVYSIMRTESSEFDDYALAIRGIIILNHIVSFIHTINATNNYNTKKMQLFTAFDSDLNPLINISIKF